MVDHRRLGSFVMHERAIDAVRGWRRSSALNVTLNDDTDATGQGSSFVGHDQDRRQGCVAGECRCWKPRRLGWGRSPTDKGRERRSAINATLLVWIPEV